MFDKLTNFLMWIFKWMFILFVIVALIFFETIMNPIMDVIWHAPLEYFLANDMPILGTIYGTAVAIILSIIVIVVSFSGVFAGLLADSKHTQKATDLNNQHHSHRDLGGQGD